MPKNPACAVSEQVRKPTGFIPHACRRGKTNLRTRPIIGHNQQFAIGNHVIVVKAKLPVCHHLTFRTDPQKGSVKIVDALLTGKFSSWDMHIIACDRNRDRVT